MRTRRPTGQRAKGPVDPGFGERLRKLRTQRGLTQEQLAGSDFTKAFISHLERGRTRVSLRAAGILAARLGANVADLLAAKDTPALHTELELLIAERNLALGETAAALARARGLQTSDPRSRARARRIEGLALSRTARSRESLGALAEAVQLFRGVGDDHAATRSSYDLAYAHASLDQTGEAIGILVACEHALASGRVVDAVLELQVRSLLAVLYARIGDAASGDLQAERALALAEDVVDTAALDRLYAALMGIRKEQGDLEGALVWARKALALHEKGGREAEAVHAWNNLAWVYIERGQFQRAESALGRAERLRAELHPRQASHLGVTRAKLELARGNAEAALAQSESLAADPALLPTSSAQARFIRARALAEMKRTPIGAVRKAFDEAIAAFASEPARKQAQVREAYAEFLARRGLAPEAYKEARQALGLYRQGR